MGSADTAPPAAVSTPDAAPPAVPSPSLKRWPGTRILFIASLAAIAFAMGVLWLIQPSPAAAFSISARTGIATVEPLCGERIVWDLPAGRLVRRSALPGQLDERRGTTTLVLLAGARARVESTEPGIVRIAISRADGLYRSCASGTGAFYEATVDGALVPDDEHGVTYSTLPPDAPNLASHARLSLLLSGRVVLGDVVQQGAGWDSRASALLESGTVDLRVVPWFDNDRVTLRTETLEEGSLFDTHACLGVDASDRSCPDGAAMPSHGFLRTRPEGGLAAQLYTRGAVGTQAFGGEQHVIAVSESTAAWHSPALKAALSLFGVLLALYQGIRIVVRDSIGWWRGKTILVLLVAASAIATTASAEPVEIRQGTSIGAGYSFRRGTSCLVVTAAHVVPQIGVPIAVADRTGARAEGTRAYENGFYDLALVSLPDRSAVACTTPWPDTAWLQRASFSSRNEFRAIRHAPNGRETIVRLQHAGGLKHQITLAPADRLTVVESDSGSIVELEGRPVGIVQSVDLATDRVNVLRFDVIDQLVGDRFRGTSSGPVSFAGVLWRGRPNTAWGTYVQSWITERAGRAVLPAAQSSSAASRSTCQIAIDVIAWERISVPNPDYSAVELQLEACRKRGAIFDQVCQAGRRAAANTPRRVLSQKLTINATITPPDAPPVTKLETTTHMPPSNAQLGRAELEQVVLQAAVGPLLNDLLSRAPCP